MGGPYIIADPAGYCIALMDGLGLEFGTRIICIVEAVVGRPGSDPRLGVVAEDVTGQTDYDLLGRIGCELALGAR